MQKVDLADWHFPFKGDPRLIGTPLEEPTETFEFCTAVELLKFLAHDDSRQSAFQHLIQMRLKADPIAKKWHRERTRIGATIHFRSYRRSPRYQTYHDAAAAVDAGSATAEQLDLVKGLNAEIAASRVVAPAGQVLFHGRGNRDLEARAVYPSFVSTSLDPTVCIYHAIKHQLQHTSARPAVYALTLESQLHAIWGNGGDLNEWELLLQTRLSYTVTQHHACDRFDVIEACVRP